jgi:rfaE bifunctional protein kinase chain/domain
VTHSETQSRDWLESCLQGVRASRVAVFGDFCLDAYWLIDAQRQDVSIETGRTVRHITEQRYSLGGAGNVVANLVALGVGQVYAVGLAGQDLFGRQMLEMFAQLGVDCTGVRADQQRWQTMVYAKPYLSEQELDRLDFGSSNRIEARTIARLMADLDRVVDEVDAVVINQQIDPGVVTIECIAALNQLIRRHPRCTFIVDSRHHAGAFEGCVLKLNVAEATRLFEHGDASKSDGVAADVQSMAFALSKRTGRAVFITRGADGLIAADRSVIEEVPGIQVIGQVDTVGAGDTVVASLAANLAARKSITEAVRFANIAASITVRKIKTTGTATPEEITRVGPEPDYVYRPELASDLRRARYHESTQIELVDLSLHDRPAIRHAVFDHDGTLSTLRQGWEQIMQPMMMRAILGECYATVDRAVFERVLNEVDRYIDQTTGVQTLTQMIGLVELVRQWSFVPDEDLLDMHGYKKLYNASLLEMVHERLRILRLGELSINDFHIKSAHALMTSLRDAGVRLYLASGTDEADVKAEAEALGFAEFFGERIYGATGDVTVDPKKKVIERILRENNLSGPELAVFGDGPVEIRLARQAAGVAVGVASDEVRRWGLSTVKRTRLIRAGASVIVPDYSQLPQLLRLLGLAADKATETGVTA